MEHPGRWIAVATLVASLLTTGCRAVGDTATETPEPYTVEPIEGTNVARVILTADGVERIGLQTRAVRAAGGALRVPTSAVWVDVDGREWVYTVDEPLVFVRARVRVERYGGGSAVLARGPARGTEVVTVGVPELIGSEFGI